MKKNTKRIAGVIVLVIIALGIGSAIASFDALRYGEAIWDIKSGINRGTVAGKTFEVANVDPNNPPTQVTEVSTTLLGIDPDRTGTGTWDSYEDGPLPEVDSYIGQLAHTDKDGIATPYTQGYNLTDRRDGNSWRLDYYQISIGEFTRASQIWGWQIAGGPSSNTHGPIQDYECLEVSATFYIAIHVKTTYSNYSVSSEWGGGKIVFSDSGAIPNGYSGTGIPTLVEMPVLGGSYDAPGEAEPTLGVNAEVGLFTMTGNTTDKYYIFGISGILKPAVRYNYVGLNIVGVHSMWDAGFIQNVRFSLAVSRPLVLENRTVDTVAPPDRDRSTLENFFDLFGGLNNFFTLVIVAAVILTGLYLIVKLRHKTIVFKKA